MVRSGTTDITDELDDLAAPRGYHMRALKVRCSKSKPCKGSRRRVESPPVAVRQADQISARYATMTVAVVTLIALLSVTGLRISEALKFARIAFLRPS